jgi:hypothetical protein
MPTVAPAIPELAALIILVVALGILLLADAIVRALFQVGATLVGWVPWLGGKAKKSLHVIEQRINNYMSDAIAGVSASVSWSWHLLAQTVAWIGTTIVHSAERIAELNWYVTKKFSLPFFAERITRGLVNARLARELIDALTKRQAPWARALAHPESGPIAAGATAKTTPLAREIAKLRAWTVARVRVVSHAIAVDIPHGIAGLRARDLALGKRLDRLWKRVRAHEKALVGAAFVAATAVALRRLGLGWIRCSNWRKIGRAGCRLDADALESLLLGTIAIVGSISIVTLAKELQDITGEGAEAIHRLIREK